MISRSAAHARRRRCHMAATQGDRITPGPAEADSPHQLASGNCVEFPAAALPPSCPAETQGAVRCRRQELVPVSSKLRPPPCLPWQAAHSCSTPTQMECKNFCTCCTHAHPKFPREVEEEDKTRTTPVGFEPTRRDPIGLAGRRLNRSAKVSLLVTPSLSGWRRVFHFSAPSGWNRSCRPPPPLLQRALSRCSRTLGALIKASNMSEVSDLPGRAQKQQSAGDDSSAP